MQNYDDKMHNERQRSMQREAKHEVNEELKEFEKAKGSQLELEKVRLSFYEAEHSGENIPFSELVNRQLNSLENRVQLDTRENLTVMTKLSAVNELISGGTSSKSSSRKPKSEYVDFSLDKMKAYNEFKQSSILDSSSTPSGLALKKDNTEEAVSNIQMDETVL